MQFEHREETSKADEHSSGETEAGAAAGLRVVLGGAGSGRRVLRIGADGKPVLDHSTIDYSKWEEWVKRPDDPASRDEEAERERLLEKAKDAAFERANPDFVRTFMSDMEQRKASRERRAAESIRRKDQGNDFFRRGETDRALGLYHESLRLAPFEVPTLSNLAAVYLRLQEADEAADFARRALFIDPHCTKAAFRLTLACRALGDFRGALEAITVACGQASSSSGAGGAAVSKGVVHEPALDEELQAEAARCAAAVRSSEAQTRSSGMGAGLATSSTSVPRALRALAEEVLAADTADLSDYHRGTALEACRVLTRSEALLPTAAEVKCEAIRASGLIRQCAVALRAAFSAAAAAAPQTVIGAGDAEWPSAFPAPSHHDALATEAVTLNSATHSAVTTLLCACCDASSAVADDLRREGVVLAALAAASSSSCPLGVLGDALEILGAVCRGPLGRWARRDVASFAEGAMPLRGLSLAVGRAALRLLTSRSEREVDGERVLAAAARLAMRLTPAKWVEADLAGKKLLGLVGEARLRPSDSSEARSLTDTLPPITHESGVDPTPSGWSLVPLLCHAVAICITRSILDTSILEAETLPDIVLALSHLSMHELLRPAFAAQVGPTRSASAGVSPTTKPVLGPLLDLLRLPVPASEVWERLRGSTLAALANAALDTPRVGEAMLTTGAVDVLLDFLLGRVAEPLTAAAAARKRETILPSWALTRRAALLLSRLATAERSAEYLQVPATVRRMVQALRQWNTTPSTDDRMASEDALLRCIAGVIHCAPVQRVVLDEDLLSLLQAILASRRDREKLRRHGIGIGNLARLITVLSQSPQARVVGSKVLALGLLDELERVMRDLGEHAARQNVVRCLASLAKVSDECATRMRTTGAMQIVLTLAREILK